MLVGLTNGPGYRGSRNGKSVLLDSKEVAYERFEQRAHPGLVAPEVVETVAAWSAFSEEQVLVDEPADIQQESIEAVVAMDDNCVEDNGGELDCSDTRETSGGQLQLLSNLEGQVTYPQKPAHGFRDDPVLQPIVAELIVRAGYLSACSKRAFYRLIDRNAPSDSLEGPLLSDIGSVEAPTKKFHYAASEHKRKQILRCFGRGTG